MKIDPRELFKPKEPGEAASVPLGGTRAERVQRVQVGLFGLGAMILLVALADVVIQRAAQTEANAVPEAAPTVTASESAAPRDPLADAGVVPELPAEPEAVDEKSLSQELGDVPPPQKKSPQN